MQYPPVPRHRGDFSVSKKLFDTLLLKSRGVLSHTLELPVRGSAVAALCADPRTEGEKPDCFSPSTLPIFFPMSIGL